MNKLNYDITNLVALILISAGVYLHAGLDTAFIIVGSIVLALNLIMLFVTLKK